MQHTAPDKIETTPELQARLDQFRAEHANDELGQIAPIILLEDDNVRIWQLQLAPGEASDLHYHEHDYYLLIFEGDLIAGVGKDDGAVYRVPPQGNTVYSPKGGTEWAFNIGDKPYSEIIVELKKT